MVNILCMKWGSKFGAEYVNNLYGMVQRNLTLPFRFVCLTDDTTGLHADIETLPIPDLPLPAIHAVSPWRKLTLLSKHLGDLEGRTLFLDLDVVIISNIDAYFTYSDKFCIIENWTQQGRGIGNSSVYCFDIGKYAFVLERYHATLESLFDHYSNEQIFLSKVIEEEMPGEVVFWPDSWCKSFKRHCLPKGIFKWFKQPILPKDAKIIVFHGNPNPPDAAEGKWPGGGLHKHVKPTPWIRDYWYA